MRCYLSFVCEQDTVIDWDVVGSTFAPEKPKKKMSVINIMDDMDCISSKVCCYIKYTCETFFFFDTCSRFVSFLQ